MKDKLRELAERWNDEGNTANASNLFACGKVSAKRDCADELLAILDAEGYSDGMCNEDNPERRCICREEFGHRVCGQTKEIAEGDGGAVPVGYVNEIDITFLHATGHPSGPRECRIASEPFGNMNIPVYSYQQARSLVDATYEYESALAELIEAVDPSIESGNIIADAHTAALEVMRRSIAAHTHPARSGVVSDEDVRDAKRYRNTISTVCEGFTLSQDVRKILESALWDKDAAIQGETP